MKKRTVLETLALTVLLLPLAAAAPTCGGKEEAPSAAVAAEAAHEEELATKRAGKADELAKAWEADANCKALSTCCAAVAGTDWGKTLDGFCGQVKGLQDWPGQVKNQVDPALQASDCKNRVAALSGMANASNPLPDGCTPK